MTGTDVTTETASSDNGSSYACRECAWRGNDYKLLDNGTPEGRAVCPGCEGGLLLARDARVVDGGVHAE
ncbi:hypothetical protein JCM17823_06380 [Halorubrum gandharaense]